MGGNAFRELSPVRMPTKDFTLYKEKILDKLISSGFFTETDIYFLRCYRLKIDHGDLDVLVDSAKVVCSKDTFKEIFQLSDSEIKANSNCISCFIDRFQVDFILCGEDFKTSKFYFDWSDFGNIIGRIGHKLGVKIGHKGMSLVVRHRAKSDHILKEIFFSKEPHDVLDLLGLSIERYEQGFDTLEEMFEYVATSKYYDPEIYKLEHRSAVSRIRDRKRTTYSMFLEWSEAHPELAKYSFPEKSELGGYSIRMPYYETEVLSRFPFVGEEVNSVIDDFEIDLRFKEVYNGRIVGEITGLARAALGEFMYHLKPIITKEVKIAWTNNPEIAAAYIKWEYDAWR